MKTCEPESKQRRLMPVRRPRFSLPLLILLYACAGPCLFAQSTPATNQDDVAQQIQQLTEAMAKAQSQIEQSQRQLDEMR